MLRSIVAALAVLFALCLIPVVAQDGTPPTERCAVFVGDGNGVLTFSGEGDVVTEPFRVDVGALIVTVEYLGADDAGSLLFAPLFTVDLVGLSQPGRLSGPLLTEAGTAQDAMTISYADDAVLDIDAAGAWTITIVQG